MQTIQNIPQRALIFALIDFNFYSETILRIFRLVFSRFFNLRRNIGNVKEKGRAWIYVSISQNFASNLLNRIENLFIARRNRSIVWKLAWFEYYLWLNLSS